MSLVQMSVQDPELQDESVQLYADTISPSEEADQWSNKPLVQCGCWLHCSKVGSTGRYQEDCSIYYEVLWDYKACHLLRVFHLDNNTKPVRKQKPNGEDWTQQDIKIEPTWSRMTFLTLTLLTCVQTSVLREGFGRWDLENWFKASRISSQTRWNMLFPLAVRIND